MLPIIDAHLHLWDTADFVPPWLPEAPSLLRTFTLNDWQASAGSSGSDWQLARAIYVEIDAAPEDRPRENRQILDRIRKGDSPLAGAVIAADLLARDVRDELAPWLGDPGLKGIRHVLHTSASPAGTCLKPEFASNIKRLGELDLAFDACMRQGELGDLASLAGAAPETRIILDHCGNPGPAFLCEGPESPALATWRAGLAQLGGCPNVACKLSGLDLGANRETVLRGVDFLFDVFGEDRLIWASNYPVCELGTPLRPWLDAVHGAVAPRGEAALMKVFALNAARVYRIAG